MNLRLPISLMIIAAIGLLGPAVGQSQVSKKAPRLPQVVASESPFSAASSPFLSRAASQPVDWRAFDGAAFRQARRHNRLVLLWIGASWCHWCHEMGRVAFEDPQLAQLINDEYVPVVVDRDLRPDVDRRYQRVVLTLAGRGGWPLLVVLTPEGDAVFGGGFFSAQGGAQHPGLLSILTELTQRWQTEQVAMEASARAVTQQAISTEALISGHGPRPDHPEGTPAPGQAPQPTPVPALVASYAADRVVGSVMGTFDPLHGGFGQAPRFPHGATLDLLLTYAESTGQDEPLDQALHALNTMADGAIRDPITGLFFRYAVDDAWQHPGFEVLLPTNAEMLQAYLHAYALTGRQRYRQVAEEIIEGLLSQMALPGGGFGASLGGEGPQGEEGGFYSWSDLELTALLTPEELQAAQLRFGMEGSGIMTSRPGAHIPLVARSIPEVARQLGRPVPETRALITSASAKLQKARAKRPQLRDDTLMVAWNARTASVLFEAQRILDRDDLGMEALRTMEMINAAIDAERTVVPHILPPSPWAGMDLSATRISTVLGLLDAFEATGDPAWLAQAQRIMDGTLERFWDEDAGGFYDLPEVDSRNDLTASRWKDVVDGLLPSTNGLGIVALQRLARWTDDPRYSELAREAVQTFEPVADALGLLGATWAKSALQEADPPPVVIITAEDGADASALSAAARATFRPGTSIVHVAPADLATLGSYSLALPSNKAAPSAPRAAAWVCIQEACTAPLGTAAELSRAIQTAGRHNGGPPVKAPLQRRVP